WLRYDDRYMRPTKPVIQAGNHNGKKETQDHQLHDKFLARSGFGAWSQSQPALNKRRISPQKVGEHPCLRQEVNRQERPSTRESHGAHWDEKQSAQHHEPGPPIHKHFARERTHNLSRFSSAAQGDRTSGWLTRGR